MILETAHHTLDLIHKKKKAASDGQVGLFENQDTQSPKDIPITHIPELARSEMLSYEKELLGFYLTEHPLMQYKDMLEKLSCLPIRSVSDENIQERCMVAGIITHIKKIMTKANNSEMAFIKLEDLTGTIELVVFPKIFAQNTAVLHTDAVIQVWGRIDKKDDRLTLLAEEIHDVQ